MSRWLYDQRVFWRQFRENFHTTGALAPSSRFLGRALARFVGQVASPQRILEVGPGTGAVTSCLVRRLGPADRLDLVELNDQFVRRLRERFDHESAFAAVANRSRVLHQKVESLAPDDPYDLIISGLPLNNFAVVDVERFLQTFQQLLRPGGTLSFFEYVAIRRARALTSGQGERQRLRGIDRALANVLGPHAIDRDLVLRNLPPAWVHHVRFGERS
jgi:phosphatidylethanolamine/phosphatidyl-N-methylethanolamine N-methyltransferase